MTHRPIANQEDPVQHFIATYAYSDDLDKRAAFPAPHRTWLADQTELLVSGPTDDDGAVLIFRAESADEVSAHAGPGPVHRRGGRHGTHRPRQGSRRRISAAGIPRT
jgi:uncharacterized protein YciI